MLGRQIAQIVAAITVAASLTSATPAAADPRVDELAKLLTSSSDKARISAVVSLGRLNDKASLKPLVGALQDPNAQVRALAATALGRLGHRAALPALKTSATDDADATVRARSREAATAVAKASSLPDPFAQTVVAAAPSPAAQARKSGGSAGFGRQASTSRSTRRRMTRRARPTSRRASCTATSCATRSSPRSRASRS
jgi:hypothetical protein